MVGVQKIINNKKVLLCCLFFTILLQIFVINFLLPWWSFGKFSILDLDSFELDKLNGYLDNGTIYTTGSILTGAYVHRLSGAIRIICPFIRYHGGNYGVNYCDGVVFNSSKLSRVLDSKFRYLKQIQIDSDAINRKISVPDFPFL